jgi:hypothetical protein
MGVLCWSSCEKEEVRWFYVNGIMQELWWREGVSARWECKRTGSAKRGEMGIMLQKG